tara:strand:- start:2799 stop:4160 length:1362 start_codon:yes stop_codon:yes gene_type:complete
MKFIDIKYQYSDQSGELAKIDIIIIDENNEKRELISLTNVQYGNWGLKITKDEEIWKHVWNYQVKGGKEIINSQGKRYFDTVHSPLADRQEKIVMQQVYQENKENRQRIQKAHDDVTKKITKINQEITVFLRKASEIENLQREMIRSQESSYDKDEQQNLELEKQQYQESINEASKGLTSLTSQQARFRQEISEINNQISKIEKVLPTDGKYEELDFSEELENIFVCEKTDLLFENPYIILDPFASFSELQSLEKMQILMNKIRKNFPLEDFPDEYDEETDDKSPFEALDPLMIALSCETIINNFIGSIVRIGPHRKRPERFEQVKTPMDYDTSISKANNLNLYATLQNPLTITKLNEALSNLDIPYEVSIKEIEGGIWSLQLTDENYIKVDINDVGYGISQVLPVILESFQTNKVILIEQPELFLPKNKLRSFISIESFSQDLKFLIVKRTN